MRRVSGALLASAMVVGLFAFGPVADATTACNPNPGAACAWDSTNYLGTKIFGDGAPHNGTQDMLCSSCRDRMKSFKNRSSYTACPMNQISGSSWVYLDLLIPLTNYSSLPTADHTADAVWFGVSPAVQYCS